MARNIEVARLFARMDLDIKNAEASTGKIGGALSGLASTITKHPVAALGTLGAAAAAAVLKLGDMAAQFEQRMAEIGTLVDKNSVDMEKLATDVLGLFASLPVESLEDLTRGLYSIVSAGVPAGDAIDVLRTAAEAAIGGVTDVNTAVDGLTTAMNAFQTQGVTAEEAADAFFVAVKAGKTTFGELSSSIGNVAGLANSLGVSLDDLLANTSALTLGGLKTSEAMNALKAVLSNIAKPTAELRREYPGLAAEFGLAALQSKGLTGFLGDLAGELSGNQQAAVKMFGSVEALNAVLSLTADGGARVARITADMEAKTGAASAAYEEMAGTTKNTEQVLKNKLEAALTKLGETVLPATNAGLEITIGLLNTLQRILDAFKGKEQPIDFGIGPAAVETLQRVLGDPRFGGTAIDLENLKAGSREYGALRGAVESLQFALQNGFTKALGVTDDALVQMRATVEAYAKAHVRSLVDAGQSADVLAQHYLDMLATIDKEIAKRKNTPQPPPGLRTVDEKAAKEAVDALAKIREAELESQLALVSTQHAEYLRLTEELNRALEKLRGDDRRAAEEAIKRTTDNLLLKWAGFVGQIKTLPARLPVTERRELESTAEGVELLKLETKDFTEILKEHGLALDEDDEKKLRAKARAKELREQIKDLADEFGESNDAIKRVADEYGLLDEKLGAVFDGIGGITKAVGEFAAGDSFGGTITGLAAIATSLKGLLGESPEAARARALLERNSEVIAENTRVLLSNTPGATFAAAGEFLAGLVGPEGTGLSGAFAGRPRAGESEVRGFLAKELGKVGLTLRELEDLAKDLNIELDFSSVSTGQATLRQLFQRFSQAGLGGFGNTFQDALERIRRGLEFGTLTPAGELDALLKAAGGLEKQPTAILDVFKGLALESEGGRAEAITRLQDLFRNFETGLQNGTLSPAALGDLNRDEFVDLIGRLLAILRSDRAIVTPTIPLGDPNGPTVDVPEDIPGVTRPTFPPPEEFAASLGDYLGEASPVADYLAQIVENTAAFKPIAPPSLEALPPSRAGQTLSGPGAIFGDIHLSIQVEPGQLQQPAQLGRQLTDQLMREIEIEMARRFIHYKRLLGSARADF